MKVIKQMVIMLGWMLVWPASAQHIVWEKVFGSVFDEQLGSILPVESGGYISTGLSFKIGGGLSTTFGDYLGVILIRFDDNGDTIYTRKLNLFGYTTPYLVEKYPGIFQTVIDARIPMGNGSINCPAIVEFNEEGVIFQTHILNQHPDWLVSNAIQTKDYGVILSGTFAGGLTAPNQMFSIKVNFLGEVEWAQKWAPPAMVEGNGRRLFQTGTNSNEFMVTGTLGRRIGGFTFDSLGNQLATKVFYETPSMRQFQGGEATIGKDKSINSFGFYRNGQNQVVGYYGKLDSLGQEVWGGERDVIFNYPQANVDGSVWTLFYQKDSLYVSLRKYSEDSVLLKSIPVFLTGGFESVFRHYLPIGNNQVLAVGYRNTQNSSKQFLITKIDSFGIPITSIQKPISFTPANIKAPVLYPNPSHEMIRFKNLQGLATLSIYNLKGQLLKTHPVSEDTGISIRELPSGQYLYHISNAEKKVFTGLFLKE